MTMTVLPLSVVIPTIGRCELLRSCLRSVLACTPAADEVIVVDQSGAHDVRGLAQEIGSPRVRVVECEGRGIARAMNLGLQVAHHDPVLVTHDDCTVAPDWVEVGWAHACAVPGGIVTGRVLPPPRATYVPSTITATEARDYTGTITIGVIYPANMVVSRKAVTAIGGFDERPGLRVAAEDNDLCYRWLVQGRPLRYEPDLVVWHHDWRTPAELVRTHRAYARGQGAFYAKHLHAGDRRILPFLLGDLRGGLRSMIVGALRGEPRWQDPNREMLLSLLFGLGRGWFEARSLARGPKRARVTSSWQC
jgi:GT2 family glycosyltransferase